MAYCIAAEGTDCGRVVKTCAHDLYRVRFSNLTNMATTVRRAFMYLVGQENTVATSVTRSCVSFGSATLRDSSHFLAPVHRRRLRLTSPHDKLPAHPYRCLPHHLHHMLMVRSAVQDACSHYSTIASTRARAPVPGTYTSSTVGTRFLGLNPLKLASTLSIPAHARLPQSHPRPCA